MTSNLLRHHTRRPSPGGYGPSELGPDPIAERSAPLEQAAVHDLPDAVSSGQSLHHNDERENTTADECQNVMINC